MCEKCCILESHDYTTYTCCGGLEEKTIELYQCTGGLCGCKKCGEETGYNCATPDHYLNCAAGSGGDDDCDPQTDPSCDPGGVETPCLGCNDG